jgi:gamma-glutamyltranspeptidase
MIDNPTAMVTSPHPAASEAGAEVLRAGGNAIESAIAMGAVLSVTCPHFCGLGGDAVWLVADASGKVTCLLGVGQAAAAASAEPGSAIPLRGPGAALTTAGAVDSWGHALAYGERHWGGPGRLGPLLEPAIALATEGFAITPSQVFWLRQRGTEALSWPGFADLFLPGGATPIPGDRMRQPDLATSLSAIAQHGARELYDGALARRIAEALEAVGAPLGAADLAATHTDEVEPLSQIYRDTTLFAPPAPTQGLATLMTMGVLQHFDVAALAEGGADHIHLVVESIKRAFQHRGHIADPRCNPMPLEDLLSSDVLSRAAGTVTSHALPWPHVFKPADTVFFGAVDHAGRCASVLQSIYFDWGSGVVAGDTGIIWHNRGAAFSSDPSHPNRLAPGKRPFMTLNPGLATRNGRPSLVYGTQGADGQPQTLALLLTRLIDFSMTPEAALRAPRFLLGRTFSDSRDSLKLEGDFDDLTQQLLAARGHDIARIPAQSPLAGLPGVIALARDGSLSGAHDPRGDGTSLRA